MGAIEWYTVLYVKKAGTLQSFYVIKSTFSKTEKYSCRKKFEKIYKNLPFFVFLSTIFFYISFNFYDNFLRFLNFKKESFQKNFWETFYKVNNCFFLFFFQSICNEIRLLVIEKLNEGLSASKILKQPNISVATVYQI